MKPPVIILAGGRGTRLRAITGDRVPKPMVPVGAKNRPFLSYLLARLRQQQYHRVILCVDHLASQFEEHYGDGSRFDMEVRYDYAGHVGTGNRGAHAFSNTDDKEAIVHCGDVFHPVELDDFVEEFEKSPEAVLQVSVHEHGQNDTWEPNLVVDQFGNITGYKTGESAGEHLMHGSGILAARSNIQSLAQGDNRVSLTKDIYPILAQSKKIRAVQSDVVFFDVGTPYEYQRFCRFVDEEHLACV